MVLAGSSLELLGRGLVWERGVLGLVWSFWITKVTVVSACCKRDSTCAVSSLLFFPGTISLVSSSDWSLSDPLEAVFMWSSASEVLGLLKCTVRLLR